MRETDTADTDHLHAQQVPCFGTIAGDTAADLSRSAFIWTAESPSVCSSEWIMHTSSPHPTHSHRFDSKQRRCFGERRREGVKKRWERERRTWEESITQVPSVLINNFNCYWKVLTSRETQTHGCIKIRKSLCGELWHFIKPWSHGVMCTWVSSNMAHDTSWSHFEHLISRFLLVVDSYIATFKWLALTDNCRNRDLVV